MKNFIVYATIKVKEYQELYDEETVKFLESKKHKVEVINWYRNGKLFHIVIRKNKKEIIIVFVDYCDIEFIDFIMGGEENEHGED